MNKNTVGVSQCFSFWNRVRRFFVDLLTPVELPPPGDRWDPSNDLSGDVFERHWRYAHGYRGIERSMRML